MISIQQMHYLVVLSEERHFQRASDRCFVTQPTLSMQIKKAEELLGYSIFDRATNPLELTSFGNELIKICREVLHEVDKIKILRQKMEGKYKERIRLGIIPTISAYLIPSLFPIWQKIMENIQVEIEEMKTIELLEALENKTIDLAILAGSISHPKWRTIPLYTEEIKAYFPGLLPNKLTTSFLDLQHPWLLNKGNCLRTQMMHFCSISNELEFDQWNYAGGNIEMLMKMVDINGGYTLVPSNYQLPDRQKKDVHRIFSSINNESPAREIIAVLPNRSVKDASIELLIREIQHKYSLEIDQNKFQLLGWE